jgi:hypothetical protein
MARLDKMSESPMNVLAMCLAIMQLNSYAIAEIIHGGYIYYSVQKIYIYRGLDGSVNVGGSVEAR